MAFLLLEEMGMATKSWRNTLLVACSALAVSWVLQPLPASAQRRGGFFGAAAIGGLIGGALGGLGVRQQRRVVVQQGPRQKARRGGEPRENSVVADGRGNSARNERVLASLAPASSIQTKVLKTLAAAVTIGAVGSTLDLNQVGRTSSKEAERDYSAKIARLIMTFQERQKASETGDITQHAIERSVEKAFSAAALERFESFLGENWTTERLKVMILNRAQSEIGALFLGTNQGLVKMDDLDKIIQAAGLSVHRRLFETSELLAANQSASLFVQRLYQTHGELVDGELREGAAQVLMRASGSAIGSIEGLLRRDQNSFALRYRARRIISDCLSSRVETMSSSDKGIATPAEIEKRIVETASKDCMAWVTQQFIADKSNLKPQEPLPLRAIWSPDGPRDDPSMYGRSSGNL